MKQGYLTQLQYQIESISQPVFVGTKDGKVLACNTSFTSLLGYELPDALHLNWVTSLTHPQHQDEDCSRLEQMIPGFSCLYSTQFLHRSGKIIPVDVVAVALSIAEDLSPIFFIVNDGHNKESLLNSEQNDDYRLLLDSINELFYTYDVTGRITFTNRKSLDILGYHPHECLGRYLWEFVPERYREYFFKELKRRIPQGKEDTYLVTVLHRDGSERVFQLKASPIVKNGKIIGEMALAEDVTERRQMEKELQFSNETLLRIREELVAANQQQLAAEEELRAQLEESEKNKNALAEAHQRLQTFIDFLPEPTFVINQQGQVELWNYAMEELTGIKARDILGRGNYEYAIPFYGRRVPMLIDMALNPQLIDHDSRGIDERETDTLFAEIYCPQLGVDGSYLSCKSAPLRERSGNLVGAIETMRNITERKK